MLLGGIKVTCKHDIDWRNARLLRCAFLFGARFAKARSVPFCRSGHNCRAALIWINNVTEDFDTE
jgi:hypothetical protein